MTTQLVPPHIEKLEPYKAGRSIEEIKSLYGLQEVYKLASNENPLGVSPKAIEAMQKAMYDVNYYPPRSNCVQNLPSDLS